MKALKWIAGIILGLIVLALYAALWLLVGAALYYEALWKGEV